MVVDEPARTVTETALPHLALHSMTQSQLKEVIHQLVTTVTGRTSPLFGSLGDKPDWWPCNLEWTSPEELADKYQNPCEKLREIVRSCYCYMDKDNLLNSSDLTELSSELPVSPAVGDTDIRAADPESDVATDDQGIQVVNIVTDETDEQLDETNNTMTIQSKTLPAGDKENATDRINKLKQLGEEGIMPSGHSKIQDSFDKTKDSGKGDVIVMDAETSVAESNNVEECVVTGISEASGPSLVSNKVEDISPDVIAQIDFEIAKSLKEAFSNMKNVGLSNVGQSGKRGKGTTFPLDFGSLLAFDKKPEQLKKVKNRRSSAEEVGWKTESYDSLPESSGPLGTKPTMKLKTSTSTNTTSAKSENEQRKPGFMGANATKTTTRSEKETTECRSSAEEPKTQVEDLPDIVKEENKEERQEDDVVWICFVCAKEFADQSELMEHQDVCEEVSPDTGSDPVTSPQNNTNPPKAYPPPRPMSVIGKFETTSTYPVPKLLTKVGSNLKSLPLGLPRKTNFVRKRRKLEDIYIPPSRDVYFESLELFPTPRVEAIAKSPRKSVTDDDCQIIDLTVEEAQSVPMTPRTRSMLSQLSRDESSGRKRQLSFSQTGPLSSGKKEDMDFKALSDSDSSNEGAIARKQKVPSKSAILGIPLTSPLGQRLKKHWKYENKVPIIENIEQFCKTDSRSILILEKNNKKNPMVEKLRHRPPPQCTFRFTKKYFNQWCHWYKFSKADQHEFEKRLKYGLDRESRLRLKRMKKCKVVLSRIGKKVIKYWTTPRVKMVQKRLLPTTAMLQQSHNRQYQTNQLQNLNRQYRINQLHNAMASSSGIRPMQGVIANQLLQQSRYAIPTPQLLVRTVPMGVQGMRLQVLPVQQTQNQNHFLTSSPNQVRATLQELPRSQKRKQVFSNVREDDDIVICLSSDEEEEIVIKPKSRSKQQSCAMCNVDRDKCRIHGRHRIGPASFKRKMSNNSELARSPKIDIKPSSPVTSVIKRTPVNIAQPVQSANTASARVFGTSLRPASQFQPPPLQLHSTSSFTHMRISDGTVISDTYGNEPVQKNASQTVQFKTETGSAETGKSQNQTDDSEFMDYEVICIDSDNEDE